MRLLGLKLALLGILGCVWAGCAAAAQTEIIDRIVVVVNGRAVLQSEWDDAAQYEALADGRGSADISGAERSAALERLIDRILVDQQMHASNYAPAASAEVEAAVAQLREQLAPHDAARWNALLREHGLTPLDVSARVAQQVNQLRYVELKFRPSIRVTAADVEHYYREELLPKVRQAHGAEPPLADVQPRIEQILIEQRVDAALTAWLETLRSQAKVMRRSDPLRMPQPPTTATTGDEGRRVR